MYFLKPDHYRRLQSQALNAQKKDQSEVVGLLYSKNEKILQLWFMKNISVKPLNFELSLKEIRDLKKKAKKQDGRILGVFHSHPISYATLGKKDLKNSWVKSLQLVYDVCGREAKLWRVLRDKRGRKVARQVEFSVSKSK